MSTDLTPQGLPLDRPRYLQETPDGWKGADHPDGPWRPIPGPQTQPPFPVSPVGVGSSERIVSIAKVVQEYAFDHKPDARLIGNVCAEDVADLCDAVLARWGRPATPPAPEPAPAADPPLWQLMLHAYDNAPVPSRGAPDDWTDRQGYAAEILAVRDRVVPEERGVLHQVHDPELHRWRERQRIRAMLTTEAARAEAGE